MKIFDVVAKNISKLTGSTRIAVGGGAGYVLLQISEASPNVKAVCLTILAGLYIGSEALAKFKPGTKK